MRPGSWAGSWCVANLPPRRVAGFVSQVLVLGALPADGRIPLLGVDAGAEPGDTVG
jgi:tRNA-binding EMAP/Myf-like protein